MRDELRTYLIEHRGDTNAALVIDENGLLNKGRHSAGVARQYSGTAASTTARSACCKPQLAQAIRQRMLAAGVPAGWGTGDRVHGDDQRLRMGLEAQPHASVLAVSGKEYVWLGWYQRQVNTVVAALPEDGWSRLSAGDGTQGPRWYDWQWLSLADPLAPG